MCTLAVLIAGGGGRLAAMIVPPSFEVTQGEKGDAEFGVNTNWDMPPFGLRLRYHFRENWAFLFGYQNLNVGIPDDGYASLPSYELSLMRGFRKGRLGLSASGGASYVFNNSDRIYGESLNLRLTPSVRVLGKFHAYASLSSGYIRLQNKSIGEKHAGFYANYGLGLAFEFKKSAVRLEYNLPFIEFLKQREARLEIEKYFGLMYVRKF